MFSYFLLSILSFFEVLACTVLAFFIRYYPAQRDFSNSILVIRLDHKIGDMVIFSDFIRKLYVGSHGKKIFLIAHVSQKSLYINCPYIDGVFFYDWGKSLLLSLPFRSMRAFIFLIKNRLVGSWSLAVANRFDEDFHAPFFLRLSNASIRIGFTSQIGTRKSYSMFLSDIFNTITIKNSNLLHESSRNLLALKALNIEGVDGDIFYETWSKSGDHKAVHALFSRLGVDKSKEGIALGIGAYAKKRIWPPKYYSDLISLLLEYKQGNINFFLLGSAGDTVLAEKIKCNLDKSCLSSVYDLTGSTTVGMLSEVLVGCSTFIGNDSGLLHLACANTPNTIEISCHPLSGDLSHSNSPARFGPIGTSSMVLQPKDALFPCTDFCSQDDAHCILEIKPLDVFNQAVILLR